MYNYYYYHNHCSSHSNCYLNYFTGSWANDLPNGFGEHIWGNDINTKNFKKQICNIYRGNYCNGLRHNFGTFYYMNGSIYSGDWKNNKKDGNGIYIYADGRVTGGEYVDDRMKYLSNSTEGNKRATDDVNTQYTLNINDVYITLPTSISNSSVVSNSVTVSTSITVNSTVNRTESYTKETNETKEIERILLRYNQSIRQLYKKYCDYSNRKRSKELTTNVHNPENNQFSKVENTIITIRNFQKRLFCSSIGQFLRFLREVGIVGNTFNSVDMKQCIREMRANLINEANNSLYNYKKDVILLSIAAQREAMLAEAAAAAATAKLQRSPSRLSRKLSVRSVASSSRLRSPTNKTASAAGSRSTTPAVTVTNTAEQVSVPNTATSSDPFEGLHVEDMLDRNDLQLNLDLLWGNYFEPKAVEGDFDVLDSQPLFEREFVELLVRCMAKKATKAGGETKLSLYHVVYKSLSEKVHTANELLIFNS